MEEVQKELSEKTGSIMFLAPMAHAMGVVSFENFGNSWGETPLMRGRKPAEGMGEQNLAGGISGS